MDAPGLKLCGVAVKITNFVYPFMIAFLIPAGMNPLFYFMRLQRALILKKPAICWSIYSQLRPVL
jgi:hypothetical protein